MLQIRFVVFTAVVVALICATAHAQTPFRHSGAESKHSTFSPLPNEHIDPASGALTVVATDLVLPGNAGFDLRVTRVYNSSLFPSYDSGSTALDEDSWAGIGWRLHFGRVINPNATTGGATSIELGDGSRQPLYTTTAYPEGWMTPGFARYNRSNHTLKLPNGYIYTFGQTANLGGNLGAVRYVTEIRDPFNNKIEFSYFAAPGPVDGISQIRQYLSPTQVRTVNFTYDGALKTLATMSYDGRTWTYVHDAHGSSGHSRLREVRAPLGPPERYDYTALPGELTRVETPAGGVTTYTYQDAYRRASTLTNRTRVVTQRTSSGRLIAPGTWTFAYGTGSNQDTTVIECACDGGPYPTRTKYRFLGVGVAGNFSAWIAGALAELTIEQSDGVVRERQEFTWIRSEALSPNSVPGQGGVWSDPDVYAALLERVTISRTLATWQQWQSWTTTHEYHTANFNDFGQPWKTTETGDFTRTTERTFQGGFGPHIVGRPASTWTRVGPEGVGASWEYDLATGFVTAYSGPQSPLGRFAARPDGNLASVKDAMNSETTYENYTWGKPQIIRTPNAVVDVNVNPDGTINYIGNAVVVHFNYDALFRQIKTWSHGVNPVFTHYDNVGATAAWSEQGTALWGTNVDGFGRVVATAAGAAGVSIRIGLDACGRPVFTSMPYTTGPGSTGSTTTYDLLGRVATVTGPDGAVTRYAYSGIDVTVTDAKGRTTAFDYSAAGSPGAARLVSVRDAANTLTSYTYDVLDNLVRVSGPGPVPDRTWSYDGAGRLLSDTQPESGTTTYVHDGWNLTRKTDAKGQIVTFEYNGDQLTKVDPPGTADDVTFTYDIHGRLASQATPSTGITFSYNAAGQLASRTDTVGAFTFVSSYTYDLNENLRTITYPSGRVITYDYDTHNRLTTVKQNGLVFADQFTYDGAGRLASYRTGTVTHTVGYDVAGRTKTLTSGSALNLTYAHDLVGNVESISEPLQPTQQFGYDAVNRLATATGPWGQRAFQYSAAGDRLIESGGGTTFYQYDTATRRLLSTSGAQTEAFTYSGIGELTSDSRGAYQYNASGLVTQFTGPNVSAAYTYDASGLRVARTVNNVTTYTVRSAGGTVLSEYRSACGAALWSRDIIYARGRLLGAIKATNTEPSIALTQSAVTVAEGASTLTATIALTTFGGGPLPCPLTVGYSAIAGTATAGVDYRLPAGSVTFNAGEMSGATRPLTIEILSDTLDEYDETFSVTLSSAAGAQLSGAATQLITITDDDAPPGVSIWDGSIVEADSGTTVLPLPVTLDAPSGKPITVTYATTDGSAVTPGDYLNATAQVTFEPGVATKTINMFAVGDLTREIDEQFTVSLSAPVNVVVTRATATATILDNDRPPVASKSDFNGDGKPDLLFRHDGDGRLSVWLMDGVTRTADVTPTPGQIWDAYEIVGTADFDADGDPDIFWRNTLTGELSVWTMNGVTLVSGQALVPSNANDLDWRVHAVADINMDGKPDLIWQHRTQGWIAVWTMDGATRIEAHLLSPWALPAGWQIVATGDLDQDGFTDLVLQHDTTGDISWFKLDGYGQVSGTSLSPASVPNLQWKIRGAADLDADGLSDLLWQNTVTGELIVWFMNGPTVRSSAYLSPATLSDLAWRIVGPK